MEVLSLLFFIFVGKLGKMSIHKYIYIVVALVLSTMSVFAKLNIAPGEWKTVRSYTGISSIIPSKEKVFVVANGGLYYYDKKTKEITTLSTLDGLSPSTVEMVEYVESTKTLFIIHSDMAIDLMTNGVIISDESIKGSEISGKKVNSLNVYEDYVYISLDAGIVVYDTRRKEVHDTYVIGNNGEYAAVFQTTVLNGDIYALMDDANDCFKRKLKVCKKGANASDFNEWETVQLPVSCLADSGTVVKQLECVSGKIVFLTDKALYARTEDGNWVDVSPNGVAPNSMQVYKDRLTAKTRDALILFSQDDLTNVKYRRCKTDVAVYDVDEDAVWINYGGLREASLPADELDVVLSDSIVLDGPSKNDYYSLQVIDGDIYLTGNHDYYATVGADYYRDGQWHYLADFLKKETDGLLKNKDYRFSCAYRMLVDPLDKDHIFVPTWWGLHEFYKDSLVKLYDKSNSILKGTIATTNKINTKAECAWYDENHNLFVSNPKSQGNMIFVMDTAGVWHELNHPKFLTQPSAHFHFRAKSGIDFIVAEYSTCALCVLDVNKTPLDASDDKTKRLTSFKYTENGVMETFTPVYIFGVEEDLKGDIWIATDQGPIIMKNVKGLFEDKEFYDRPKITREDDSRYADFLLAADKIRKIQVDGRNRKWIATEGNGVFLVSPNGDEILENFTTKNSPLSSNTVMDIVYERETGILYIMTDTGIFMYATDSSFPEDDYENVTVYPNPVRPDYDGDVEIKGLVDESNVRITDQRGLVIENGLSKGGTYRFSARRSDGTRLPTGVYNIFITTEADEEGLTQTKHLKFAVVR